MGREWPWHTSGFWLAVGMAAARAPCTHRAASSSAASACSGGGGARAGDGGGKCHQQLTYGMFLAGALRYSERLPEYAIFTTLMASMFSGSSKCLAFRA